MAMSPGKSCCGLVARISHHGPNVILITIQFGAAKESTMEVKQAVSKAKEYIADLLMDEGVANIGLEEVNFDDQSNCWLVTIGFTRQNIGKISQGKKPVGLAGIYKDLDAAERSRRTYRVVKVADASGEATAMVKPEWAD